MPLVLESEAPKLEGVEGDVSKLGGEEKPSWGEGLGSVSRPLGMLAKERDRTHLADSRAITLGLFRPDHGLGMSPIVSGAEQDCKT